MFRWRQRTLANTNSHTELYPDLAPEPTPLPRLKSTAMGVSTPSRLSMSRYTRTSGTSSLVFDFFLLYCHILLKCVLQKTSVYDLVVECSTVSEPEVVSTTSVVVSPIDVNDNPPRFTSDFYYVSISEDTAISSNILQVANQVPPSALAVVTQFSMSRYTVITLLIRFILTTAW